ncbi:TRAP transporter substrate-binding protein DctP [Janthinobacterium fluminis]|uniref:TRAP transporter substrate-binding protein DctP n=1 Tax=Janthinobacterium fluminis TaxID=2987524 RepID=A0ABT5JZU2_9BURK|nr:TRAP transporter substrate-binding protein DctP [Janthinobacterium fluminis]MDC8758114.1 TRAP transporter substrate-binding protein DctP [Janthinobacterium fluminis]
MTPSIDTKRRLLCGALAGLPLVGLPGAAFAQAGAPLKISHQFPGSTGNDGDFRDRLCRLFAAEVEKRSGGALKFSVYPGSSLMKTNAQFSALRRGALDLSFFPISYAGGEVQELNIALMPGLVTSYEQGYAWHTGAIGKALNDLLFDKGAVPISWVWEAGSIASRTRPVILPADVKGMKIRGGSREVDLMLKAAGSAVVTLPSNELYAAVQTGAVDSAITSSTSLLSFRLEEVSKHLTTGRGKSFWFMAVPLLMSRAVFEKLPKDQQALIMTVGAEVQKYGLEAVKADDVALAAAYQKAGAKTYDLDAGAVDKWRAIARDSAWKDYAAKSANCARLLQMAEKVVA